MQTIDGNNFNQRARRIRDQVSTVLTNWGLLPRFKRWRLTQDPETGMVVLFGILNNRYIATHTSIPFSNYFDLRLLQDLSNQLQVQVVSCNSDGLRYAFILDRGRFGKLPTHVDYPYIDNGKLLARVVYNDDLQPVQVLPADTPRMDDQNLVRQGVGAFLKTLDDIQLKEEAALLYNQSLPEIVVINEEEFNKLVAEHEADWQKRKHIGKLSEGDNIENTQGN